MSERKASLSLVGGTELRPPCPVEPSRRVMPRILPLGDALPETIARMEEIAAHAGDRMLLADGPVHPDWHLLLHCAKALNLLSKAEALRNARAASSETRGVTETADLHQAWMDAAREGRRAVHLAKKLKATTPAGLYAKALIARSGKTGASEMAQSLAVDMLDCKALRACLWSDGDGA